MTEEMKRRGKIKWNSAMMMPEYVEALQELFASESHVPRPILDPNQIETIHEQLQHALKQHCQVTITYYRQHQMHQATGMIKKWDQLHKVLTLTTLEMLELRLQISDVTEILI